MNYDANELLRSKAMVALSNAEQELYTARERHLPMKDERFSSELARKTHMEAMTATEQVRVDSLLRELELLADRAQWLINASK